MKWISRTLGLAFLLCPALAGASGTIEAPAQDERMASQKACLAFLRNRAAEDAQLSKPETVAADGSRQTVTVETKSKGVERLGRGRARYAARLWYVNGWPRPDLGQMEYRASWEEHSYECRGRKLVSRTSRGFANASFEPLQAGPETRN